MLDINSYIEPLWVSARASLTPFQFRCLGTFVLHELFYWSSYLPFLVCDSIPSLRKYKIQPSKTNDIASHIHCFTHVAISHLLVVMPSTLAINFFQWLGITEDTPLPSPSTVILQVIAFFIIEDYLFYWIHRALHTEYLYKTIHSVHHKYAAPLGIAAEYAHPLEVVGLGFATAAGPLLLRPHLLTLWVYLFVRCFQTVECHSGYDFPWSPRHWIPGYGGAEFHDHHHKTFTGNYASTFVWTDWVHGTDGLYRSQKAEEEAKAAKKLE